jgi:hypothetical protein
MSVGEALPDLPDLVPEATARRYERWLADEPGGDAYLYTDARVRFDARDDDVLVAAPGLSARALGTGTRLEAPLLERGIDVPDAPFEPVARFLGSLDGERTLAKARIGAGLTHEAARSLLGTAFGIALFSPLAVALLERAVPSAEIVRFPGSPYEIPRNYWQNMASVRTLVPSLLERANEPEAALDVLRRLHVVALLGEDASSFYRPASPIAKKGVWPGRLWLVPSRTLETEAGTRFVEGPRVGARFLGGDRYGALVAELAGDVGATRERLEHRDEAGLDWGRVIVAKADTDRAAAPWFCPPRPITRPHLASLFESLAAQDLADFHQKFMRLHPFRAANQAVAMSVVNAILAERPRGVGRMGIPHLILDHLAFRLAPAAYERVFELATRAWSVAGAPAERARAYAEHKLRYYALVERIARARDAVEARAIAEATPDDAELALVALPRDKS